MNENCEKKRISPYALAALLVMTRLFALSMYVPSRGENAALTAVTGLVISLLKLPLMYGAARLSAKAKRRPMIYGAVTAFAALVFIAVCADAFTDMLESLYPERMTKAAAAIVLILVCIYTASMGIEGTARTACIMLGALAAVMVPILFEMRGSMLTDRLDLFSHAPIAECTRSAGQLLRYFFDPLIFAALLPYAGGADADKTTVSRTVKPYLIADGLITCVFFLMNAAVMGRFFGQSGYAFFTLSYNTHGSIIDRANGIFTCVSTIGAVLTLSALMLTARDGIKLTGLAVTRGRGFGITACAALAGVAFLAANGVKPAASAPAVSLVFAGFLIAGAAMTALGGHERAKTA